MLMPRTIPELRRRQANHKIVIGCNFSINNFRRPIGNRRERWVLWDTHGDRAGVITKIADTEMIRALVRQADLRNPIGQTGIQKITGYIVGIVVGIVGGVAYLASFPANCLGRST